MDRQPAVAQEQASGRRRAQRWTDEEHELLFRVVEQHLQAASDGLVRWPAVASEVGHGRTGKQCRERWLNFKSGQKRGGWTANEEEQLAVLHSIHGPTWRMIAKEMPERPENCIKNHWNTLMKQSSRLDMRPETLLIAYMCMIITGWCAGPETLARARQLIDERKAAIQASLAPTPLSVAVQSLTPHPAASPVSAATAAKAPFIPPVCFPASTVQPSTWGPGAATLTLSVSAISPAVDLTPVTSCLDLLQSGTAPTSNTTPTATLFQGLRQDIAKGNDWLPVQFKAEPHHVLHTCVTRRDSPGHGLPGVAGSPLKHAQDGGRPSAMGMQGVVQRQRIILGRTADPPTAVQQMRTPQSAPHAPYDDRPDSAPELLHGLSETSWEMRPARQWMGPGSEMRATTSAHSIAAPGDGLGVMMTSGKRSLRPDRGVKVHNPDQDSPTSRQYPIKRHASQSGTEVCSGTNSPILSSAMMLMLNGQSQHMAAAPNPVPFSILTHQPTLHAQPRPKSVPQLSKHNTEVELGDLWNPNLGPVHRQRPRSGGVAPDTSHTDHCRMKSFHALNLLVRTRPHRELLRMGPSSAPEGCHSTRSSIPVPPPLFTAHLAGQPLAVMQQRACPRDAQSRHRTTDHIHSEHGRPAEPLPTTPATPPPTVYDTLCMAPRASTLRIKRRPEANMLIMGPTPAAFMTSCLPATPTCQPATPKSDCGSRYFPNTYLDVFDDAVSHRCRTAEEDGQVHEVLEGDCSVEDIWKRVYGSLV